MAVKASRELNHWLIKILPDKVRKIQRQAVKGIDVSLESENLLLEIKNKVAGVKLSPVMERIKRENEIIIYGSFVYSLCRKD